MKSWVWHASIRGREAPGKTPFVAAVQLNPEGRPSEDAHESRWRVSKREDRRCDGYHLEPGTVVLSDALVRSRAVRHAGCIHLPVVTGGGPASARNPAPGQRVSGQRRALDAWQLSPRQLQAPATMPRRVLLSVQPPVLASRDARDRVFRHAHAAHAQPSDQAGQGVREIRNQYGCVLCRRRPRDRSRVARIRENLGAMNDLARDLVLENDRLFDEKGFCTPGCRQKTPIFNGCWHRRCRLSEVRPYGSMVVTRLRRLSRLVMHITPAATRDIGVSAWRIAFSQVHIVATQTGQNTRLFQNKSCTQQTI